MKYRICIQEDGSTGTGDGGSAKGYTDANGNWVWYDDWSKTSGGGTYDDDTATSSTRRRKSAPASDAGDALTVDGKTLDDFIREAAGDGPITAKARSLGRSNFDKAMRRKKKGRRTSTVPQRPDSPLRTHILDALDESMNPSKVTKP